MNYDPRYIQLFDVTVSIHGCGLALSCYPVASDALLPVCEVYYMGTNTLVNEQFKEQLMKKSKGGKKKDR